MPTTHARACILRASTQRDRAKRQIKRYKKTKNNAAVVMNPFLHPAIVHPNVINIIPVRGMISSLAYHLLHFLYPQRTKNEEIPDQDSTQETHNNVLAHQTSNPTHLCLLHVRRASILGDELLSIPHVTTWHQQQQQQQPQRKQQ